MDLEIFKWTNRHKSHEKDIEKPMTFKEKMNEYFESKLSKKSLEKSIVKLNSQELKSNTRRKSLLKDDCKKLEIKQEQNSFSSLSQDDSDEN